MIVNGTSAAITTDHIEQNNKAAQSGTTTHSRDLILSTIDNTRAAGLSTALNNNQPNPLNSSAATFSAYAESAPVITRELSTDVAKSALDDALLSMDSYADSGAPEGFTRLSAEAINQKAGKEVLLQDDDSGFFAAVYQNNDTGDITLAFRGSESSSWQEFQNDWLESDVGQAFFTVPASYKQGAQLAGEIRSAFGEHNVSLTGHSLGGGIANYAAIEHNLDYTVFNAAGLAQHTVNSLGDKVGSYTGEGTVINDAYDPLTNYGGKFNDETWGNNAKHIGYDTLVFVDNNSFNNWWDVAFNVNKRVDAHNLKNVLPQLQQYASLA